MDSILILAIGIGVCLLVFFLRTFPFGEKKSREPETTARAEVTARRIRSGNPHRSGRSQLGYTFLVTFRLENGRELELYAYEEEYGGLREGMAGLLTWKGRYFVRFDADKKGS